MPTMTRADAVIRTLAQMRLDHSEALQLLVDIAGVFPATVSDGLAAIENARTFTAAAVDSSLRVVGS